LGYIRCKIDSSSLDKIKQIGLIPFEVIEKTSFGITALKKAALKKLEMGEGNQYEYESIYIV